MSSSTAPASKPSDDDGSFRRQESSFRQWVSHDASTDYPVEAGRYHLYVARACPWAHRTIVARRLMGLEQAIGISFVDPIRDERSWAFTGGEYVDPLNGFEFLSQAYSATDPDYELRVTVPVLWDKQEGTIVNNESADVLRMLGTVFAPLAEHPIELYPERYREEIDELNGFIYENVNNAVYRAGFAKRQEPYENAVRDIFSALDDLDARLADRRFLFGDQLVETDIRLFTTLVRFDPVYQIHFKCSMRKLIEYEHLWPYVRDLYHWPGIADTVSFDEIRDHYYRTHEQLNPQAIVPVMPTASYTEPHGREQLAAS